MEPTITHSAWAAFAIWPIVLTYLPIFLALYLLFRFVRAYEKRGRIDRGLEDKLEMLSKEIEELKRQTKK